MKCPKCQKVGLRKHFTITVSCNSDTKTIDKAMFRKRDVTIISEHEGQTRTFCPNCQYQPVVPLDIYAIPVHSALEVGI